MRVFRLFGVVLTILTAALLWATPADAQPPSKLTDRITDSTGVLAASDRAAVSAAIDRLNRDRHIQLWVVYVDNFNRFKPDNWADRTRSASAMGDHDALLAVATNTKSCAFSVPPQILTAAESNKLRTTQIEPVLGAKDWSGAAVAAADGLDKSSSASEPASSSKPVWPLIAIAVIVVVLILAFLLLLILLRARRRRRAARGSGQLDIGGGDHSTQRALSTAEARVRQISDYVARYRSNIGSEAQARLDEAKRHLAAAHGTETGNDTDAIAYANRASTLAAQAQTLANADVVEAHRTPRRRGKASTR
ncbi:YgcG family protein [Mycobacterium sp. E2479]|uniref:TPM domain-containing protein n=1 Tax=Mycobacterium sp. E2479 TaxID=1834134 RepID=UPI0007FCCF61|nr:TPM domain-containing protein [Mycobacterium sp. E2479]OBH52888.1 hypothetical protein A5686_09735 [Mycobacterium sp. E2479]